MHHRRFSVGLFVSLGTLAVPVGYCATIQAGTILVGGHILQYPHASIPRSNLCKNIRQSFFAEETTYSASVVYVWQFSLGRSNPPPPPQQAQAKNLDISFCAGRFFM